MLTKEHIYVGSLIQCTTDLSSFNNKLAVIDELQEGYYTFWAHWIAGGYRFHGNSIEFDPVVP